MSDKNTGIKTGDVITVPDTDANKVVVNPEVIGILASKVLDALDDGTHQMPENWQGKVEDWAKAEAEKFVQNLPALNDPAVASASAAHVEGPVVSETPVLDKLRSLYFSKTGQQEKLNAIQKDQLIGTDSVGGYIVEREDAGGLLDLTINDNLLSSRCQQYRLKTNAVRLPTITGDPTVYTVAESTDAGSSTTTTESTATFGAVTLTVYRHGLFVQVSNELMEDSDPQIEAILRKSIQNAIGSASDWSILHGTGSAGAAGSASSITGLESLITTNVLNAGGTAGYDDIVDLMTPEDYCDGDITLATHPVVRRQLLKTKDNDGRAIWESGFQTGGLPAVLGMGLGLTRQMSKTLGGGAESAIVSGAFGTSAWCGVKSGVSIIVDPYTVAEYNSTRFVVNYRAGFQVSSETHFAWLGGITV